MSGQPAQLAPANGPHDKACRVCTAAQATLYVVLNHFGAPIRTGTGPRATAKLYRSLPTALAAAASRLASVVREVTLEDPHGEASEREGAVCVGRCLVDATGAPLLSGGHGHRTLRLYIGDARMAKVALRRPPQSVARLVDVYLAWGAYS